MIDWLKRRLGLEKERPDMSQSHEKMEERALQDRLIEEHRKANAAALAQLKVEAPRVAHRYVHAMDHAMAIMRGDRNAGKAT